MSGHFDRKILFFGYFQGIKNVAKSMVKQSKTDWTLLGGQQENGVDSKIIAKTFGLLDNVHYICISKIK